MLGWRYRDFPVEAARAALDAYKRTGEARQILPVCGVVTKHPGAITDAGWPRFRLKCYGKRCRYERVVTVETMYARTDRAIQLGVTATRFD